MFIDELVLNSLDSRKSETLKFGNIPDTVTFLQLDQPGLVHPLELLHLQQFPAELDLAEVIHAFPHEILVVRVDPRPQRTQDEVGVIDADNLILIVADILPKHPTDVGGQ